MGLKAWNHEGTLSAASTKRENVTKAPVLPEIMGLRWCLRLMSTQNMQNVCELRVWEN